MTTPRWRVRPEGSNWGDFGADDECGRLNLLSPERVRVAAREIREGVSFCLSLPLDYPGGQVLSRFRNGPRLHGLGPADAPRFNYHDARSTFTDIECDDAATLSLQYSTHWDSLAHIGQLFDLDGDGIARACYYNGFRAGEDILAHDGSERGGGADHLGIETMAETCLQGRGVIIDLKRHLGDSHGPVIVGFETLDRILTSEAITVEAGDIVCFHTGFSDMLLAMGKMPRADELAARSIALDGRDERLLDWISATGIAAIAADNFAVEAFPARTPRALPASELPLHEHCLFKLGVPLGELWHLGDLARFMQKADRSRFFLTAPPLRLPGAVGSPVTPVATV